MSEDSNSETSALSPNSARLSRRERIIERLRELGAEPKRSLGQNFLVSDHVVEKILSEVSSRPFSQMVEVGPGLGALTEDLLTLDQPLTLIELDQKFADYWRGRVGDAPVEMHVEEGDALQINWLDLSLPPNTLFVSNLPYQISSSLVIERCLEPAGVSRMVLMFQKEVAQRLSAKPRTPEYGLLTVIAQSFWEISMVCDAGPQAFLPPPNVSSRVMAFRARENDWLSPWSVTDTSGANAQQFLKFVKAAFAHRRKLMIGNLLSEYYHAAKGSKVSNRLEEICKELKLLATARAEELDPKAFIRLYLAARDLA